ncbi:MAG: DUF3857 domain-containing protein [Bacteroidota bacterium]
MKLKKLNYLFCLIFVSPLFGQNNFSEEYNHYKEKYPEKYAVRLLDEDQLHIDIVDHKIEISATSIEQMLYLNQSAKSATEGSVSYSNFVGVKDIEANSYHYERGKYRRNKVDNFVERDVLNNSFYDDVREISFRYPKLNEGAKSSLIYTNEVKNPRFIFPSYFGSKIPVAHKKLSIEVDNDIEIDFVPFNMDSLQVAFNKEVKRNYTTYTWELKDINAYEDKVGSISFKEYVPHIVPIIKSYKINDNTVKVLGGVEDLYNWYAGLTQNLNNEELSPELAKIAEEITVSAHTNLEKVKQVYYWTQQNIKYIDVEYGIGGFVPRDANTVYHQKYGDCKDNSSIMSAMLNHLGITTHLTWLGTRKIPYSYHKLATPMVDNHMILTYIDPLTDKAYFLDATGRFLPLGMPSSFIQGKEALIGIDDNNFEIREVPWVAAEKNFINEKNNLQIEENNLVGKATNEIGGYDKIRIFNRLENSSERDRTSLFRSYFKKPSRNYIIENIQTENEFAYDESFKISFDFTINQYIQKINDEIYVNLNLSDFLKSFEPDEVNDRDIVMKHKKSNHIVNQLEIPENYQIKHLPENAAIDHENFYASINYEANENEIIYTHDFFIKSSRLTPEEQKNVKEAVKQFRANYNEMIILSKI